MKNREKRRLFELIFWVVFALNSINTIFLAICCVFVTIKKMPVNRFYKKSELCYGRTVLTASRPRWGRRYPGGAVLESFLCTIAYGGKQARVAGEVTHWRTNAHSQEYLLRLALPKSRQVMDKLHTLRLCLCTQWVSGSMPKARQR